MRTCLIHLDRLAIKSLSLPVPLSRDKAAPSTTAASCAGRVSYISPGMSNVNKHALEPFWPVVLWPSGENRQGTPLITHLKITHPLFSPLLSIELMQAAADHDWLGKRVHWAETLLALITMR